MQNQNGLSNDIRAARKNWKQFWGSLFGDKEYNKYAYMDNPNSIADEMLFAAWVVALICAGFTLYYGISYHLYIFQNNEVQNWTSFSVSIALFMIAEILVFFFGHRLLRAISNGFLKDGLANLVLWILMGCGVVYGFFWRYDISAKGYALVNKQKATQEAIANQTDYKVLTADIDQQIASANKSAADGAKVTWKGKITEEGQHIIKQSNRLAEKLLAQKSAMIAQAQSTDSMMLSEKKAQIELTAVQQGEYGGKAEYLVIFSLLIIALCERINYNSNKKRATGKSDEKQATSNPNPLFKIFQVAPTPTPSVTGDQRPTIGFKQGYTQTPVDTQTVVDDTQPVEAVSTATQEIKTAIRTPQQLLADLNQYTERIHKQENRDGKASDANYKSHTRIFNNLVMMGYNPIWNGRKYVFADKGVKS